jgi:phosphatidylglycerol:prolipoprotein diacylglycerol transferase
MIPYIEQPSLSLGPVTLHAFGVIVATSAITGDFLYRRRLVHLGLDIAIGMSLGWWALVTGFVAAHLFSLIFYFPEQLARNPWALFKIWENVSSFGGMLGGAVGAALFLGLRGDVLTTRERWAYLDAAAFVLPFAWAIGRIACSLAHDHPGTITSFPLAISLESARAQAYIASVYAEAGRALPTGAPLGFHDLGWYEFLYLSVFVAPLFLWLDRRTTSSHRRPGFWIAMFTFAYAPMRLVLDTLRVVDKRYFGLTPGQYAAAVLLLAGVIVWRVGGNAAPLVDSSASGHVRG